MRLLSRLARYLAKPPKKPDPGLLDLAIQFRSERAAEIDKEIARRDSDRMGLLSLRSEIDRLRAFRREAEKRMMRHGIEIPDDDTQ